MALNMFKRMLLGGAIGGAYGGMSDNGSALGGAIGGAAAFGPGVWAAGALSRRYAPGGIAGGIRSGMGRAMSGSFWAANRADQWTGGIGARLATGLYRGAGLFGRGSEWIGRNAVRVNEWGGRALMGAGLASGAMIGSSIISSNNGY